jgi:hypothetical protein
VGRPEWGSTAEVIQETIRNVVVAFGEGKIELPAVPEDTPKKAIRFAPRFGGADVLDVRPERSYTAASLGIFLGWLEPSGAPQERIYNALSALELIEEGVMKEEQFAGLGPQTAAGPALARWPTRCEKAAPRFSSPLP